jgi:hypothetical protein
MVNVNCISPEGQHGAQSGKEALRALASSSSKAERRRVQGLLDDKMG